MNMMKVYFHGSVVKFKGAGMMEKERKGMQTVQPIREVRKIEAMKKILRASGKRNEYYVPVEPLVSICGATCVCF